VTGIHLNGDAWIVLAILAVAALAWYGASWRSLL
jgi:hypothetical protein